MLGQKVKPIEMGTSPFFFFLNTTQKKCQKLVESRIKITMRKSLMGGNAFPSEDMVAIKDLKNPSHTPNLLVQIWIFISQGLQKFCSHISNNSLSVSLSLSLSPTINKSTTSY